MILAFPEYLHLYSCIEHTIDAIFVVFSRKELSNIGMDYSNYELFIYFCCCFCSCFFIVQTRYKTENRLSCI